MKLVVTADLHDDITRSAEPARRIAAEICSLRADALLLLGDVAGRDPRIVSDALHLFDRFAGARFFVAGNHDLWTDPGGDSLDRLERVLPELCREAGFHPLDVEPAFMGSVGLVGSIGWYDFSFHPERLGIPLRFYQAKIAPGAATRLPGYEHLLADTSDVPEAARAEARGPFPTPLSCRGREIHRDHMVFAQRCTASQNSSLSKGDWEQAETMPGSNQFRSSHRGLDTLATVFPEAVISNHFS